MCRLIFVKLGLSKKDGLKERIDRLGLYPITVSTLLKNREKKFLLSREIVIYRELIGDVFYLNHLGVSDIRKGEILNEIKILCNHYILWVISLQYPF